MVTSRKNRDEPDANYWVIFEVESLQNVRFLAETEQVRIYGRFQHFLDGLGFPLKFISLVETVDQEHDPALLVQRQAVSHLTTAPQLQKLQVESLKHQQASLQQCTTIRHFVVVSASTSEIARLKADGSQRSPLMRLFELIWSKKVLAITREQVKNELRIRVSIVKKALQQLDVHAALLDDAAVLQAYVSCLALGTHIPSYEVEVLNEEEQINTGIATAAPHGESAIGQNETATRGSTDIVGKAHSRGRLSADGRNASKVCTAPLSTKAPTIKHASSKELCTWPI